ncbi:hypothetical protein Tdes44962_MAKER00479 [Teratosphaeria destructans]|uniref:Uncharacterized protein n=1 Tax=Teratosphaeria destructans TaxID=418781 RepID=A0A9W7SQ77_9PEZI|nr:hypothetical protein Tdes44962_MAKER00479 [Teratosphaeria destructans]
MADIQSARLQVSDGQSDDGFLRIQAMSYIQHLNAVQYGLKGWTTVIALGCAQCDPAMPQCRDAMSLWTRIQCISSDTMESEAKRNVG